MANKKKSVSIMKSQKKRDYERERESVGVILSVFGNNESIIVY